MGIGGPDLNPPQIVIDTIMMNDDNASISEYQGLPELRQELLIFI
jgi:aspartate/methionine/tyrosine aminotransferase